MKRVAEAGKAKDTSTAGAARWTGRINGATAAIQAATPFATLEAQANADAGGALSAQLGDAYLANGENAEAPTFHRQGLQKGGAQIDEVNTQHGIALA